MMQATLIAHTEIPSTGLVHDDVRWHRDNAVDAMHAAGYVFQDDVEDGDDLAEFAGRNCYQSWSRPNPETATNRGYLANILAQQHYSVLEHASATFLIKGVSRSLTHELVRHRHLSFSQLSQRYVDESRAQIVIPPVVRDLDAALRAEVMERISLVDQMTKRMYTEIDELLDQVGISRKAARGAARCVLPSMVETVIVVSGNMRAWREMLLKRLSPAADVEIRELAVEILRQLKEIAPNTFQDLK